MKCPKCDLEIFRNNNQELCCGNCGLWKVDNLITEWEDKYEYSIQHLNSLVVITKGKIYKEIFNIYRNNGKDIDSNFANKLTDAIYSLIPKEIIK